MQMYLVRQYYIVLLNTHNDPSTIPLIGLTRFKRKLTAQREGWIQTWTSCPASEQGPRNDLHGSLCVRQDGCIWHEVCVGYQGPVVKPMGFIFREGVWAENTDFTHARVRACTIGTCRPFLNQDLPDVFLTVGLGCGFGADHRGDVPFASYRGHITSTWSVTADVDLGHLIEAMFVSCLHGKGSLPSPSHYCPLRQEVTVHSPHWRCEYLGSVSLTMWYLHECSYTSFHRRFFLIVLFICLFVYIHSISHFYQHGLMDFF